MDAIFVEGMAAFISALLIFCGSVWLLLTMLLGGRLAYFVTASVTLAFVVMIGTVWSFTQLGPVGQLPSWQELSAAEDPSQLEGPQVQAYPDAPWQEADPDDEAQTTLASELESDATSVLEEEINNENITAFAEPSQAVATEGGTRLLEADGQTYGIVQFEPAPEAQDEQQEEDEAPVQTLDIPEVPSPSPTPASEQPDQNARVLIALQLDQGNPLGQARMITLGAFLLLLAHLFGLSRSERRSKALSREPGVQ